MTIDLDHITVDDVTIDENRALLLVIAHKTPQGTYESNYMPSSSAFFDRLKKQIQSCHSHVQSGKLYLQPNTDEILAMVSELRRLLPETAFFQKDFQTFFHTEKGSPEQIMVHLFEVHCATHNGIGNTKIHQNSIPAGALAASKQHPVNR